MTEKDQQGHSSIVCIGASAGGLEAIERFFQSCPNDLNVPFVVIQHLSSHYKSMMDDLINRYTSMPVKMIEHGVRPEPNTIYLIEAGTFVTLRNGMFFVEQKSEGQFTLPIDIFLQSLSENKLDKTIVVILSGTGSDGSRGAIAVNGSGGFVIAQEPEDASFDGMPHSVISTGVVDDIKPADKISSTIARYLDTKLGDFIPEHSKSTTISSTSSERDIKRILGGLKRQFGIDFTRYKEATILRRIERRMQVKHMTKYQQYADFLETDPVELTSLRRELLIPVTNFFRDQSVFEYLEKHVVTRLVQRAEDGADLRVWIAGCSTGEEAYSVLILFCEEIQRQKKHCDVKIFATDVNPDVVDIASRGYFPESIGNEIDKLMLTKYFSKHDSGYQIASELRQQIVFAVHNLLTDAPFTKMDLVSCRNTLIYLKNEAQSEALQKLQYAILEGGFLMLGKSESLTVNAECFEVLDRKLKLYQNIKKTPAITNMMNFKTRHINAFYGVNHGVYKNVPGQNTPVNVSRQLEMIAESQIKKEFVPLCLLLNQSHEVVHIYGDDTDVLKIKPGNLSYQLGHLLPDKISPAALALLYRLDKESGHLSSDFVEIPDFRGGEAVNIKLKGWALEEDELPKHYVLSFELVDKDDKQSNNRILHVDPLQLERINHLELELAATRESLQSTIEELETTNEELQATNEELMASNEELQSSNEELQSVNEELNTVNAEYHEKMSILNRINADLDAMSRSTGIATVFVDNNQNLTRFTPDATEIFKVRDQDLGRPLSEIVNYLEYDHLYDDIDQTILTGRSKEMEVLGRDGNHHLTRIVSYRLPSLDEYGAAISIIESTNVASYQKILDALPEHISVLDQEANIVLVNAAWDRFASQNSVSKQKPKLGVGVNYLSVCHADEEAGEIALGIKAILAGKTDNFSLKYPCHSPSEKRWYVMEARKVKHPYYRVVVSHFNVTQWEGE